MPLRFRILLAVIIFQACRLNAQQSNPRYSKEVEEKISKVEKGLSGWIRFDNGEDWNLKDRMAYYHVPGVSIAVIKNFKLEWARGYGFADTSDKRPVTTKTLFQAASISKSLNAMGVLQLVDKKKIDTGQDINNYLTSWKFPYDSVSKNKRINILNLLTHTAGLTVHGFPGYEWTDSIPSDNEILDGKRPANTEAVRSQFEPGLRFEYSGGGTTIAKKIIMDITGLPYDEYMDKQVLAPIGMNTSFYTQPPPPGAFPLLATAHDVTGKQIKGKFHIYPEQAADGLWTNPTDLSKFIIETQLSLQGKSNKVLSKEMTTVMLTPYIDKSAAAGVFINTKGNEKYFQHDGANVGFRCLYMGNLQNGNGVVVMVNSDNGRIMSEIVNSVAKAYEWKDFYNPVVKTLVKVSADTLKNYVGEYTLNDIKLTVTQNGDQLLIAQNDSPPTKMYFFSNTEFVIMEENAQIQFQKNSSGQVDAMVIHQNGQAFTAKKTH
jgi:CubicO group peptidase (beta-lactamase class C family)